jgi:hypothetical protein
MGEAPAEFIRQPVRQCSDDLLSVSCSIFPPLLLLHNPPPNLEIRVNLNQVHAPRHRSARPGDQLADAIEKLNLRLHSMPRTTKMGAFRGAPRHAPIR